MLVKVQSVKNGKVASVHPRVARALVSKGTVRYFEELTPVAAPATYQTRDMRAAEPAVAVQVTHEVEAVSEPEQEAPYGYKADGTPRKRPGRPASTVEG